MRAATRESAMTERVISIVARVGTIMVLVISIGFLVPKAAAQSINIRKSRLLTNT